MKMWHELTKK